MAVLLVSAGLTRVTAGSTAVLVALFLTFLRRFTLRHCMTSCKDRVPGVVQATIKIPSLSPGLFRWQVGDYQGYA